MCGPRGLVSLVGRMKKTAISTVCSLCCWNHFSVRVYTGKPGRHAELSMWSRDNGADAAPELCSWCYSLSAVEMVSRTKERLPGEGCYWVMYSSSWVTRWFLEYPGERLRARNSHSHPAGGGASLLRLPQTWDCPPCLQAAFWTCGSHMLDSKFVFHFCNGIMG